MNKHPCHRIEFRFTFNSLNAIPRKLMKIVKTLLFLYFFVDLSIFMLRCFDWCENFLVMYVLKKLFFSFSCIFKKYIYRSVMKRSLIPILLLISVYSPCLLYTKYQISVQNYRRIFIFLVIYDGTLFIIKFFGFKSK